MQTNYHKQASVCPGSWGWSIEDCFAQNAAMLNSSALFKGSAVAAAGESGTPSASNPKSSSPDISRRDFLLLEVSEIDLLRLLAVFCSSLQGKYISPGRASPTKFKDLSHINCKHASKHTSTVASSWRFCIFALLLCTLWSLDNKPRLSKDKHYNKYGFRKCTTGVQKLLE